MKSKRLKGCICFFIPNEKYFIEFYGGIWQNWQLRLAILLSRKTWMEKLTLLFSSFLWLPGKELVFAQFCGLTRKSSRNRMEKDPFLVVPAGCWHLHVYCLHENVHSRISVLKPSKKNGKTREIPTRLSILMVSWKFVFILQISMTDGLFLGEFEGK